MKTSTRWLLYSFIRIGLFAALFAGLMLIGVEWWLSAIFATVLAFAISYLLLHKTRDELALDLQHRRARGNVDPDADIENEAMDRVELAGDTSAATAAQESASVPESTDKSDRA